MLHTVPDGSVHFTDACKKHLCHCQQIFAQPPFGGVKKLLQQKTHGQQKNTRLIERDDSYIVRAKGGHGKKHHAYHVEHTVFFQENPQF